MTAESHYDTALARLSLQYRDKPKLAALLRILTGPAQELEAVLQAVLDARALDVATGAQLEELAAIVGQARANLTDEELRLAIRVRVKVNNSSGSIPELLDIVHLLAPDNDLLIKDEPPGLVRVRITGAGLPEETAVSITKMARQARAGGVEHRLDWSPEDDATTFTLDGAPAGLGLSDDADTTTGGTLSGELN